MTYSPTRGNQNGITRADVFQKLASHNAWRSENAGEQAYFSHADLSNINLQGANFTGATFDNVNFSFATLRDCDFSYCSFRDTNFAGADLTNSRVNSCNFHGASFPNANFTGTHISNCMGNGRHIKNIFVCRYVVNYTSQYISASCLNETISWWQTATYDDFLEKYNESDSQLMFDLMQQIGLPCIAITPASPVIYD